MGWGVAGVGGGHVVGWPTAPEGWPGKSSGVASFSKGVANGVGAAVVDIDIYMEDRRGSRYDRISMPLRIGSRRWKYLITDRYSL